MSTTIDVSQVVYAPEMVLEVRSALQDALNSQLRMVNYLMKKVDMSKLNADDKEEFHQLGENNMRVLNKLKMVIDKEDSLCHPDTLGLR